MFKKYMVLMNTENWTFIINVPSLKMARFFMNLRFWKYAKIHDNRTNLFVDFIERS